jgi:hypothetical protein
VKTLIIGPSPIKDCEAMVNKHLEADTVKILKVEYMMVSANFVHPEQSYIMGVITYRNKFFGL